MAKSYERDEKTREFPPYVEALEAGIYPVSCTAGSAYLPTNQHHIVDDHYLLLLIKTQILNRTMIEHHQ